MPSEQPVKKGLPPWMGTFADLCTLLLTFFVLMLTFANIDLQKFREMLGSVQEAFGVQYQQRGEYQPVKPSESVDALQDSRRDLSGGSMDELNREAAEAAEAADMARNIRTLVNQAGMGKQVDVKSGRRGVRLRVKGHLFFQPGHAEVRSQAKKLLASLVKVMNKFNFYLTVEGHTDSVPISTPKFPSNWELSSSRASAVLRELVGMGINPRRVTAVGYADNYPVASNSSEEGREKNRRVEFLFTKRPPRKGVN